MEVFLCIPHQKFIHLKSYKVYSVILLEYTLDLKYSHVKMLKKRKKKTHTGFQRLSKLFHVTVD